MAERGSALRSAAEALGFAKERLELQGAELGELMGEVSRRDNRIDELERVATHLAERVVERHRELSALRAELARDREHGEETVDALAALSGEIETMRRQARGQATRIRLSALRQAADVSEHLAEIGRRPDEASKRLVGALAAAVERLGIEDETADAAASGNGHLRRRPGDLFEGLVEVEIGPLADFSQLVGFEDAARSIAATSELSIKRFSEGRATLAMNLKEPVALLHELEKRCDLEFQVRDRRSDRIILDVGEEPDAEAA